MMYHFGVYTAFAALGLTTTILFIDAWYRELTKEKTGVKGSLLFQPQPSYAERYIFNHNNQTTDLGKWNHNFGCFSKDKNCGRDYDWIKKEN